MPPFGERNGDAPAGGKRRNGAQKRRLNDVGSERRQPAETFALQDEEAEVSELLLQDRMGFPEFSSGPSRLGWLVNLNTIETVDKDSNLPISAICGYFLCQDGSMFRSVFPFRPYFYLQTKPGHETELDGWLRKKFEGQIADSEIVQREDLDLENHLSGVKRTLVKVLFRHQDQLTKVRREVLPIVYRNKNKKAPVLEDEDVAGMGRDRRKTQGVQEHLVDIREYDVPHHMRFCIDTDVRCGCWYTVSSKHGKMVLEPRPDLVQRAEARVCAFDIETTKMPLQFPNAEFDQVFMISYMVDRKGYLITNREIVSEDIQDFEYTPKPEFEGPFTIFNCENEAACLRRWFEHMREVQPSIFVTYNGDFFDWPFIETRAGKNGMDMAKEIGFRCNRNTNETLSRFAVHLDCMHWVNRDSYLPQGSRGLKMVTKYKLGYDPVEVDPEDMVRFAAEKPQHMASYSVSDAVATYYLYMTYVHPFILSLATIIPMPPDEVLRKGSGTLCEALLMVQAFKANVVAPNKHTSSNESMYGGRLLDSETYIGGKVEALESGVFRSDLPCKFKLSSAAYQGLLDKLDADLEYALRTEGRMTMAEIENYAEVREQIASKLAALRDMPSREETPLIYHLDVAAMYPNIILTNRLQPSSIVSEENCAACDFNRPGKTCLRKMDWVWRGETFSATRAEYLSLKAQLQSELFPPGLAGGPQRGWFDLPGEERSKILKQRLKNYCQKVYKRVLNKPVTELRNAGICQRENSFYYDTVESFRDRRYEYKGLNKKWKGKHEAAKASGNPIKIQEAADMCVLYDSLQLAHKCILNSFYGYVMRKGARWYSMEMAGVVTHTGANIIKRANELIKGIGRPLELDTDGIWCALPGSFPENYQFKSSSGRTYKLSYPCAMLNVMVAEKNTNNQFAVLEDSHTKSYRTESRMSIEFEVDGPYKAMILPASKEEGKLIKKRYAVFNFDGTLAELKGFELKRRGELKLIKVFQGEIFDQFLKGGSLEECYSAVAAVANRWLDMIDTQGYDLTDAEVIDLISEMSVMSKSLEAYEGRKSCAITCALRLSQFLGDERIKDKGLVCNYIVARTPTTAPTSGRAVPVAIFSTEPAVAKTYLRRWCGDIPDSGSSDKVPDVRGIVDWQYYRERLGSAIQKIITIPAAMQLVPNPVPRIAHPEWLLRKVREKSDTLKQQKLDGMLVKRGADEASKPVLVLPGPETSKKKRAVEDEPVAIEEGSLSAHRLFESDTADVATTIAAAEHHQSSSKPQTTEEGESAEPESGPARHKNYAGWLAAKKRQWRADRDSRSKRRRVGSTAVGKEYPSSTSGGVAGMLVDRVSSAAQGSHWQIVALDATKQPGIFRCWTLINGRMRSIPLRVPRSLYANVLAPPTHPLIPELGPCVKKLLPRGQPTATLVQIVVDEMAFQEQLPQMNERLLSLGLLGVYEDQLHLDYAAALQLGCVAATDDNLASNAALGLDLSQLVRKTVAECEYLEGGALRYLALYQASEPARGLHIFALHVPVDTKCLVWVVNPAARAQQDLNEGLAARLWSEALSSYVDSEQTHKELVPDQPSLEIFYHRAEKAAFTAINRALHGLRDRALGPSIIMLSSPQESAARRALPALGDWPTISTPSAADTSTPSFPTLGWQAPALRNALSHLIGCPDWLQARLKAARYAHLPLGSMGPDWMLDAADALYARQLWAAGHLLWSQKGSISQGSCGPSSGSSQGSSSCGTLITRPVDRAEALLLEEQKAASAELTVPGLYRAVCCEIRIIHLAVNAVLEAVALSELEGTALTDDGKGCGPAFVVLRNLAQAWLDDASKHNNMCADALLLNLYRWICSPSSQLFDPALKQTVQTLMRKLLMHLVSELKRLGATVIHANQESIIICTGKSDLRAALGSTDYILETLRKREILQYLNFIPGRTWHALLYRNRFDYVGIAAEVPEPILEALGSPGGLGEGELLQEHAYELGLHPEDLTTPQFDYVFTLKEFLPPAVHGTFIAMITQFLWLPWKAAMEGGEPTEGEASQRGTQAMREAAQRAEEQTAALQELLPNHFTPALLKYVRHIAAHVAVGDGKPDHQFPIRAGSHLNKEQLGTPALAFIRSVCATFFLDRSVADDTMVLQRQLLRMVHVAEFSPDAAFIDPCATLVLRDVLCCRCGGCADLDVCRDPKIQAHDWSCECGAARDQTEMESMLCGMLGVLCDGAALQDLRCARCGSVATEHLRRQCDRCGGPLRTTQEAARNLGRVSVFKSVARFHSMPVLEELADWVLQDGAI